MQETSIEFDKWVVKQSGWNDHKRMVKIPIQKLPVDMMPAFHSSAPSNDILPDDLNMTAKSIYRGLTCISCQLQFEHFREQQQHFKSDLHLANLKRKMKNLPIITPGSGEAVSSTDVLGEEDKESGKDDSSSSSEEEIEQTRDEDDNTSKATLKSNAKSNRKQKQSEEYFDHPSDASSDELGPTAPLTFTNESGLIQKTFSSKRGPEFRFHDAKLKQWDFVLSTGAFGNGNALSDRREWSTTKTATTAAADATAGASSAAAPATATPWHALHRTVLGYQTNSMCAVLLLRSGRFAGAVFQGERLVIHKVLSALRV
jgi:hypothetical protein